MQMLQCDDGHWAGDYAGPMFLMPGLIIAFHVTRNPFAGSKKEAMEAYLRNHQQVLFVLCVFLTEELRAWCGSNCFMF